MLPQNCPLLEGGGDEKLFGRIPFEQHFSFQGASLTLPKVDDETVSSNLFTKTEMEKLNSLTMLQFPSSRLNCPYHSVSILRVLNCVHSAYSGCILSALCMYPCDIANEQ